MKIRLNYSIVIALMLLQVFPAQAAFLSGSKAPSESVPSHFQTQLQPASIISIKTLNQKQSVAPVSTGNQQTCLVASQNQAGFLQETAGSSLFRNQASCFSISVASAPVELHFVNLQMQEPSAVLQKYTIVVLPHPAQIKNSELAVPTPVSGQASSVPIIVVVLASFVLLDKILKFVKTRNIYFARNSIFTFRFQILRC